MRSGLFSESGETARAEKSPLNCIRTGSERAGAIMAGRAGSDYSPEVKGLAGDGGPQRADPEEKAGKEYERYWKPGEGSK